MTILIVEDEPRSARLLRGLVEVVRPDAQVLGICSGIEETVQFLSEHSPTLIFMDIELSDGNSLEIFKQVHITAPVIFCTAYDEYMLEAFKTNGIAYLLKPINESDIRAAFAKVQTIGQALLPSMTSLSFSPADSHQPSTYQSSYLVRYREKMVPVSVANIAAISFENEVPYVYTMQSDKYALFKTMDEIESSLDPAHFFRISRQMIISRWAIVEIEPYPHRKVIATLKCNPAEKPIVSRLKVASFLAWVENRG
jgi:two-component system, LytTR family, response regulator LytT